MADREKIETRLLLERYGLDDKSLQAVTAFGKIATPKIKSIIDTFYQQLSFEPEFAVFFTNSEILDHVKAQQVDYWQSFFQADVNPDYIKSRQMVGRVHADIGLPVSTYLKSMSRFVELFTKELRNNSAPSAMDLRTLAAITSLAYMDTSLAVDAIFRRHAEAFDSIAQGDFSFAYKSRSDDDTFGIALSRMTGTFQEMEQIFNRISTGDLSANVHVKSAKDSVAKSMNNMLATLRSVTHMANLIAAGDYEVDASPRGEGDQLGIALQRMTQNLRKLTKEREDQLWLARGISELSNQIRGNLAVDDIGARVLSYLCERVNAQTGTLYLLQEDRLQILESHAIHISHLPANYELGEGLVGQVARERKIKIMQDVPHGYLTVRSSLGEASPANIVIFPLIHDEELIGVGELGAFKVFTAVELKFLELGAESIAIAFSTAIARAKVATLLKESQRRGEALRVSNEELEQQTKALIVSEEELQKQQEELESFNQELEEKTQTLERQKKELEAAQIELKEKTHQLELTNQYKSEFLANMSHELRTPLNSLLILSKLFADNEEGNLSEEQVKSAKVIYNSGSDLLEIINDVLDLAKIEAGKKELNLATVRLAELAESLERQFRPVAEQRKLQFDVRLEPELPESICTDRGKLQQSLKNLLSNAFKFTDEGKVQLQVRNLDPKQDKEYYDRLADTCIACSVVDSGIGIAKAHHNRVFEAFQQVDGTTSRKYGGTGLGLSISREYIRMLGGDISIASQENEGSTFTIFVPTNSAPVVGQELTGQELAGEKLVDRTLADRTLVDRTLIGRTSANRTSNKMPPLSIRHYPGTPPANMSSDNISRNVEAQIAGLTSEDKVLLIVEDDVNFANLLCELAKQFKFKPLVAMDGSSALQMAAAVDPKAILLDVMLPGMDGWAVLGQLKDNTETRHIPVQFISAYEDVYNAVSQGAIGFLKKPVSKEQLNRIFTKIEEINERKFSNVLVVEKDLRELKNIETYIASEVTHITGVETGEEAAELLKTSGYDCVIMDMGTSFSEGIKLLALLIKNNGSSLPPFILYTTRNLEEAEEKQIRQYSNSIAMKNAYTAERLLDEVSLFLHSVVEKLPLKQQRLLVDAHDQEAVFQGKKVLLVDDDMRNTFAVAKLLQSKNLTVIIAENGQEALQALQQNPDVNMVLMDIMMPVMDGYEAIAKIRSLDAYQSLPIVALTAKAMAEDRHKCIAAGASDYITKPIEPQRLLSMLRVWLQK